MTEQLDLFAGDADMPKMGEQRIPVGARRGTCRSCGASVVWISTAKGAAMPIDASTIRIIKNEQWGINHFATCPQGKGWSNARRNKS
jgi:hypothetical protein